MDVRHSSRSAPGYSPTAATHNVRDVFVSREPLYNPQLAVFVYTVLFHIEVLKLIASPSSEAA
jgi:hypothetical protein